MADPTPNPAPTGRRRCQIREHRVQIKHLQRWMQLQQKLIESCWSEKYALRRTMTELDRENTQLKAQLAAKDEEIRIAFNAGMDARERFLDSKRVWTFNFPIYSQTGHAEAYAAWLAHRHQEKL